MSGRLSIGRIDSGDEVEKSPGSPLLLILIGSVILALQVLTRHGASAKPSTALLSQGRIFHVSPTGDDANDGLTPEAAWRTIQHAADKEKPGDIVLIHDGVYRDSCGDWAFPVPFRLGRGAQASRR